MKKTTILIILLTMLLISGCNLSDIKLKIPGTSPSGKEDFIGGTKGAEAEIISPAENGKAYFNTPFRIVVKVNNEGESAAEGATCAFGSFSGCECQDFKLEGKRRIEKERLEGEEETLTFEGGQLSKEELEGTSHFVTAKTRYSYKTYSIIKACIKKDIYSEEKGECKLTPGKNIIKSVSSAPVSILEVTEELIPEENEETAKLVLGIKIKNLGEGNLYSLEGEKTQCETITPETRNKIDVKLINAPGRATCDQAELKKEETTTHCTVENVKILGESYEPEITIELEYAYETTDSNQFEVV